MAVSRRTGAYWGLVCACACIAATGALLPREPAPAAAPACRIARVPDEAELLNAVEKAVAERPLIGFLSMAFLGVIAAGVFLDAGALWRAARRRPSWPVAPAGGGWGIGEVLKAALLFLAVFFALNPLARLLRRLPSAPSDVTLLIIFQFAAELAAVAFIAMSLRSGTRGTLTRLGLPAGGRRAAAVAGVRAYVCFLPVMLGLILLTRFAAGRSGVVLEPQAPLGFFFADLSRPALAFLVVFVTVIAPVFEEVFFRGFAYQAIRRRWGRWPGILATALVFSALHANAAVFLPIFGLGILLACVFEATGSLVAPITVHICQNGTAVAAVLLLRSITRS